MRKAYQDLTTAELASLPRVTKWRAKRRGWVYLDYHQPRNNLADVSLYLQYWEDIEYAVHTAIRRLWAQGCLPHKWMETEDIAQDIRLYILRKAKKLSHAQHPRRYACKMAFDAGCKALGLYGKGRVSLSRTARLETRSS